MTTFRGHYLPVEARREVLSIYRDRRVHGDPITGPLWAMAAMRATRDYFSGWLAYGVAFDPVGNQDVKSLTDQYRAAEYYLQRMYDKPQEFKQRPPRARRHASHRLRA